MKNASFILMLAAVALTAAGTACAVAAGLCRSFAGCGTNGE